MSKKQDAYNATREAAFDSRVEYETAKNANNANMQKTLADMRKLFANDKIASIMLACNVDANFINRNERNNARYNVYAAEKVANVARYLAKVASLNHYSLAIIKTAHALERASLKMTHKDAARACTNDSKLSDKTREAIVSKCCYAKTVAANTTSTQSSSSINALQTFNVLSEARDENNNVVYTLNRESDATKQILSALELQ
jgi:hypothetical protein